MLPYLTDDEIYKECNSVWITKTGWGWTFDEFKGLLGYIDDDEDVTLACGQTINGKLISYWYTDWRSFSHGWIVAYKHYMQPKEK